MPRLQRLMKWTGTAVITALLALYALNLRWDVAWVTSGRGLGAVQGAIVVGWPTRANAAGRSNSPGWMARRHTEPFVWWPRRNPDPMVVHLSLPLWMPLVLTAVPTGLLWRRDWRSHPRNQPGHCRRCGYDLTGVSTSPCPECGEATKA